MPSALYVVTALPELLDGLVRVDNGDPALAGEIILHAAPGAEPPAGATALMTDAAPWTWGAFAAAYPELAAYVLPNEWAGEASAIDATPEIFPLLAPPEVTP